MQRATKFARLLALLILAPTTLIAGLFGPDSAPWGIKKEVKEHDFALVVEPPIGQQATREIGESLVRSSFRRTRTTTTWQVTLNGDVAGKMGFAAGNRAVNAVAGTTGPLLFHSSRKSPMFCVSSQGVSAIVPKGIAGCVVDTDGDGTFDALAFPGYAVDSNLPSPVGYELKEQVTSEEVTDDRSYQVDVLYQGISKGEVKISYREFKGGISRPAFTQDITYELESDGSGVIAFRGLRIQIIKATRVDITYIVQKLGAAPI